MRSALVTEGEGEGIRRAVADRSSEGERTEIGGSANREGVCECSRCAAGGGSDRQRGTRNRIINSKLACVWGEGDMSTQCQPAKVKVT